MGDERGDDAADRRRADVYSSARIGAAAAIAEAVFERIDVLGANDFTFALTAQARARGWDAAFGPGVVRVKQGQSGRGERIRTSDLLLPKQARYQAAPHPDLLILNAPLNRVASSAYAC